MEEATKYNFIFLEDYEKFSGALLSFLRLNYSSGLETEAEHEISFCKLLRNLPEHKALIEQADYFGEDKMQYLRKKVLDMGNDNIRNNDDDLEKFTIEFEFNN